jgi:K+-sensing histidine kinase KdpD
VLELLDAGIDVYTTLNVQHVESLNDVVAQITGVRVRETVPDSVLDAPTRSSSSTSPPEELLAAAAEGKVYLPEQAERAAEHFFSGQPARAARAGAAAHRAARRRGRARVPRGARRRDDLARGRAHPRVRGAGAELGRLIRAAARMAPACAAPWVAAYVEAVERCDGSRAPRAHLRLAESLGGEVVRLEGPSVVEALLSTRASTTSRGSSSASRRTRACATGCAARCSTRSCAAAGHRRPRDRRRRIIARHAAQLVDGSAYVLLAENGSLREDARHPEAPGLDQKELGVARWCLEHGQMAGLGTDTLPGSRILAMPLRVGESILGVLALEPHGPAPPRGEQREFLDAFCRQAAFAFERNRLVDEAQTAALRARTEEVRSALLSAVSHDLRTPLAIITGTATALRDDTELDAGTRTELVESICDEAERLERLVSNLLDMTRLAAGTIALKREWVPMVEVVGSALSRLESRLGDRPIVVDLPVDLPLVSLDPVLFEQAFVNLFENAVKYTPAGSPIEVHARLEGETTRRLVIEIDDRGPGLVPGTEESIFEKFYRGAHVGVAGVGLGLPICRAILDAHGGRLDARNRPGGGASFRMVLPLTGAAPTLGPADPDPEPAGGTDD